MKLSKPTLEWLIYHALHSDVAGYTEFGIIKEIDEALENRTLEIEGYKQVKDVDSIDGKPLSEGEIALIRAIRRGTRLIDPLRQIQKEKEARNETK